MGPVIFNFVVGMSVIFVLGCRSRVQKAEAERKGDREKVRTALGPEVSLKQDRSELAELRKEIPEDKKASNDELALYLNLMKQGTEQPAVVRDRFNSLVSKRRQAFREKVERLRADFRAAETRRREDFTQTQHKSREAFLKKKRDHKEMQRFSSDQDRERTRFYAEERERRANFESDMRAQSKDFESFMREKMNDFNERYRLYSKEYSERPKEGKAVTGDDSRTMDELPAKALGTEE